MSQWLRELAALGEGPSSVSTNHMVAHNCTHFMRLNTPLAPAGTRHTWCRHTCRHSHTHRINVEKKNPCFTPLWRTWKAKLPFPMGCPSQITSRHWGFPKLTQFISQSLLSVQGLNWL